VIIGGHEKGPAREPGLVVGGVDRGMNRPVRAGWDQAAGSGAASNGPYCGRDGTSPRAVPAYCCVIPDFPGAR